MERTGGAVIELTANRRAVVDGCDGIVDYDDEHIVLRMGRLNAHFYGQNLKIKRLTGDSAVIEGTVEALQYTY